MAVMLVLGIVVLFMVVRPLVRRVLAPENAGLLTNAFSGGKAGAASGAATHTVLLQQPGGSTTVVQHPGTMPQTLVAAGGGQMMEMAQVQGQVHAPSIHRIGELAERNPSETAAIIRQWLAEPA
jgi:flagellar M-ring protein FliF